MIMDPPESEVAAVRQLLKNYGQDHLLTFYSELPTNQKISLLNDIKDINFENLNKMFQLIKTPKTEEWDYHPPFLAKWSTPGHCDAPKDSHCLLTSLEDTSKEIVEAWRMRGLEMIRAGQVGCVIMAGGQGSRLGWEKPKGSYPIGPISEKSLFTLFCERLLRTTELADTQKLPPLYVMTSDHNFEATVEHFEANDYFSM